MRWEYRSEMVIFEETDEGLTHPMEWLEDAGREEWELVSAVPLVAPNPDGVAYGTIGIMAILKRALDGPGTPRPETTGHPTSGSSSSIRSRSW